MQFTIVDGDIVEQSVDAIVNAWNRNIIPWWLLLPQGVSGAIKRRAGLEPFRELARFGPMALGDAVVTTSGRLGCRAIIHVAGIDIFWRASERSIRSSVRNAMDRAREHAFRSVAFPIIGAGSGGFDQERALAAMREELAIVESAATVTIVRYAPRPARSFTRA